MPAPGTQSAVHHAGFGMVSEACTISGFVDGENRLYFAPQNGVPVLEAALDLQQGYESAEAILFVAFADEPKDHGRYFQDLLRGAQLLVGTTPDIEQSRRALLSLKDTVLRRAGPVVKKRYLNALARCVLSIAALFGGLSALSAWGRDHLPWPSTANYLLSLAVATLAIWLSFASRKQRLTFEELADPEGDMMSPLHRVAYVSGFTVIIHFLCSARVANVSLGDFKTENINASIVSAVIFGFSCGFSERLLAGTIAPHVSRIMSGLGRPAP